MATLTTPILALPYPDGAERVMDGDNAIGALASSLDGIVGRLAYPSGAVVTGTSRTLVTAGGEKLPLSGLVGSATPGFFDDAGDQLVIPTGRAGLFEVNAYGTASLPTAGGILRVTIRASGSVTAGQSIFTNAGFTSFWTMNSLVQLAEAATLQVWAECSAGNLATVQVLRFGAVRIGTNLSTGAALLREAEGKPAPE